MPGPISQTSRKSGWGKMKIAVGRERLNRSALLAKALKGYAPRFFKGEFHCFVIFYTWRDWRRWRFVCRSARERSIRFLSFNIEKSVELRFCRLRVVGWS